MFSVLRPARSRHARPSRRSRRRTVRQRLRPRHRQSTARRPAQRDDRRAASQDRFGNRDHHGGFDAAADAVRLRDACGGTMESRAKERQRRRLLVAVRDRESYILTGYGVEEGAARRKGRRDTRRTRRAALQGRRLTAADPALEPKRWPASSPTEFNMTLTGVQPQRLRPRASTSADCPADHPDRDRLLSDAIRSVAAACSCRRPKPSL